MLQVKNSRKYSLQNSIGDPACTPFFFFLLGHMSAWSWDPDFYPVLTAFCLSPLLGQI